MMKTLITTGLAVAGVAAGSFVLATPAHAAYYQQQVSGSSKGQCDAAGWQLAESKRAEGYLVTFTGCGFDRFSYVGVVGWSD